MSSCVFVNLLTFKRNILRNVILLTLESFALGDSNHVNHFVLSKDALDGKLLLEMFLGKVDLISDGTTVKLDLDDMSLLLTTTEQLLLGVADDSHHLAVLLDLIEFLLNLFLADIVLPLKARLGKGLFLGL